MSTNWAIRVDEFGMGFPPRAIKLFKKGETEYTLNWIPFGGFVKIYGEDSLDRDDPDYSRSLVSKKWWQQILVLVAGVTMNIILAWVLFSFSFMVGAPTAASSVDNPSLLRNPALTVLQVLPSSPAETAGLQAGDKIIKVTSPTAILGNATADGFTKFIQSTKPGQTLTFEIKRGQDTKDLLVAPNTTIVPGTEAIGVSIDIVGMYRLPFFKSLGQGFTATFVNAGSTLRAFGHLIGGAFKGQGGLGSLTGPVGLVSVVTDARKIGFVYVLLLSAIISINLAIINLVPFPALDGGRILFVIIEKIIRRPLPKKFFEWANGIGFFLLIALMIAVTVKDVIHLF